MNHRRWTHSVVSWRQLLFVALLLVVAMSASGLVALVALAEPITVPQTDLAPADGPLDANPELRFLPYSPDGPVDRNAPPFFCAALGSLCYPINPIIDGDQYAVV
jgi:hypothetical protein